jgi:cell pole-organizing protein PopZ
LIPIRDRAASRKTGQDMAQDGEASVEEILESIKKVIARDNRAGAQEARRRREQEPDAGEASDTGAQHAHIVRHADEVLDLTEMECEPEPTAIPLAEANDAPLIADTVRDAMQENLAALAMLAEPGARPQIVRSGETSLEGLTRELLRPMLAEWLEANLPEMVENLVQAEIARIVGKRR